MHAVDESAATVSVTGSQETVMVGAIGSYFDLGSEWSLEQRGENAEVSCLPSNIGVDTYPLHETKLSMCGGDHVAAGGGKLHEFGAIILGLETDDVRGNMVNLLVRFRVMEIGKAPINTRSQPLRMGNGLSGRLRGCTLDQESIEHSHHAREETVCMVLESQTQASP